MRSHRLLVPTGALLTALGVALTATPSIASDPASHDLTVPTEAGEVIEVEWTGLMPPGANTGDCNATPVNDPHEVTLTVPPGTYDEVIVNATFYLEYDGPFVDAKFTLVRPDGSALSADGGFVQTNESLNIAQPEEGTYTMFACMFLGANPVAYDGRLVMTATPQLPQIATGTPCDPPTQSPKFEEGFIDTERGGGEPMVTTHPDGTMLWGSHAGTTHFFGPAAPDLTTVESEQHYQGQTYQYYSDDEGATWHFVSRLPIDGALAGLPNSGFSDPEFAIDAAGNVYISEINLANVAVSKSTDSGRSYTLQNIFGFTLTDRQWNAADEENVLYMTGNGVFGGTIPGNPVGTSGHMLAKSTDGGITFSQPELANPDGVADIQIDPTDGTLYELSESGGTISMAAFRDIRSRTSGFAEGLELNTITTSAGMTPISRQIGIEFDMDREGNLYVSWPESGAGTRPAGIYYSFSTDRGRTWFAPVRVDIDAGTDVWPWIAVGAPGQVAVSYLHVDAELEDNNAELATDDQGWHVMVAHSDTGLGCDDGDIPGFSTTRASAEPVHYGTICQGGTICQAELVDRRLGDYFSHEVSTTGRLLIAVANTTEGGALALPWQIRQVSGPSLGPGGPPPPRPPIVDPPDNEPSPAPAPTTPPGGMPATGGGAALIGVGLASLALGVLARRRR